MGAASNIQIESVILHLLDPKNNAPLYSQRPLPLPEDEPGQRVLDYFRKHIANSQEAQKTREARFESLDTESARLCRGLLAQTTDLVAGSQELAKKLHGILKANQSISRGDLVVCLYRDKGDGNAGLRLALLKIDHMEGFRQTLKEDYVAIEIDTELMPGTSQELQKCAFIRLRDPHSPEPDMALLDLQGKEEKVALFFTKTFLGAKLMPDPRETTRRFLPPILEAENELLSLGEWKPFKKEVRAAAAGDSAHLTKKWVGDLPVSQEAKEKVETQLTAGGVLDRTIPLDKNLLEKLTDKVKYQGSYGLKFEVLERHFDEVVKSIKKKRGTAGKEYFEIILHSPKLKRVS